MAEKTQRIVLTWENGVGFQVATKYGDDAALTLVEMDENGHIEVLWPAVTDIVTKYIRTLMGIIGDEMKV